MPAQWRQFRYEQVKRIVAIGIGSLLAVFLVTYGGDYLVVRYRIATNHDPYGSVTVQRYYAVKEKSGKTEFMFSPPEPELCLHSLFPHFGYKPCWYLSGHTEIRTDI
jgi:uncharacterized membrane protein